MKKYSVFAIPFMFFGAGAPAHDLSSVCAKAIQVTVELLDSEYPGWYQSKNSFKLFRCKERVEWVEASFSGVYNDFVWRFSKTDFSILSKQPDFKVRHRANQPK